MSLRSRRELQKKSKKAMSRTTEQKKKKETYTLHLPPIRLFTIPPSRQDHMKRKKKDSNSDILLFFSA